MLRSATISSRSRRCGAVERVPRHARLILLLFLCPPSGAGAQTLSHRGYAEALFVAHPQTGIRDETRLIADSLVRWEPTVKAGSWRIDAAVDGRMDSHRMTERSVALTYWDRTIRRPALAVARLSASWARGPLTVEFGKQFVRWGKTDILVPTDRFAPRDYVNVSEPQFLGITAARMTLASASDSLDIVVSPRVTPSRAPLLDQRWVFTPPSVGDVPLVDTGAKYPSGVQSGVRWNHLGRRLEHSVSFYRGFHHLPWFEGTFVTAPPHIDVRRRYAQLTTAGADIAMPVAAFTIKAEAAWFHSDTPEAGEYLLYVVQLERQSGEWLFLGGYAGEYEKEETTLVRFAPDRGLARAFIGRASVTLDANRSLTFDGVLRQNAEGVYGRVEYSHGLGGHWRAIGNVSVFGGSEDDFLGRYQRNSFARLTLRYSF
jgi:hypothetical protein